MIVVDLPPEEDAELCRPALDAGLSFVRLVAPTTDEARLPAVLTNTSGFVYYISITGITGAAGATTAATQKAVDRLRRHTALPIAVGFGIKTPDQAAEVARVADAAVVGSALVSAIEDGVGRERRGDNRLPRQRARAGARARRGRARGAAGGCIVSWLDRFSRPKVSGLFRKPDIPQDLWEKCEKVRADDFSPGAREQSPGLPALRPPHAARCRASGSR